MQIYHAIPGEPIPLGRRWEHHARRIVFDISGWVETFGAGTVMLLHQRQSDEAPYPVAVTRTDADSVTVNDTTGTLVLWDVTNTDTYYQCHYGKAELRYYLGTGTAPVFLAKSDIYKTVVENTLGAPLAEAPEEAPNWMDTLLAASQRLDSLDLDGLSGQVSAAQNAATNAYRYLTTARTQAEAAQNAAQNAATTAQNLAQTVQSSIDEALRNVATSPLAFTNQYAYEDYYLISTYISAERNAVITVQAQVQASVVTDTEGDAESGWTELSQAEVTISCSMNQYDSNTDEFIGTGSFHDCTQTVDSGTHAFPFLCWFTAPADGDYQLELTISVTGGYATVYSYGANMLVSGAKRPDWY